MDEGALESYEMYSQLSKKNEYPRLEFYPCKSMPPMVTGTLQVFLVLLPTVWINDLLPADPAAFRVKEKLLHFIYYLLFITSVCIPPFWSPE